MTVILLRHGTSEWNKENLFCGWIDVDLADKTFSDTERCYKLLNEFYGNNNDINIDVCYTSVLKRSIKTANYLLDKMDLNYIPVIKSWRLNERFYGDLTGNHKNIMKKQFGSNQLQIWRRSYKVR